MDLATRGDFKAKATFDLLRTTDVREALDAGVRGALDVRVREALEPGAREALGLVIEKVLEAEVMEAREPGLGRCAIEASEVGLREVLEAAPEDAEDAVEDAEDAEPRQLEIGLAPVGKENLFEELLSKGVELQKSGLEAEVDKKE